MSSSGRSKIAVSLWLVPICLALLAPGPAKGAIEIEKKTEELRAELESQRLSGPEAAERIAQLQKAIAEGQAASEKLREQIEVQEEQAEELRATKNLLASGLIGALVTAMVGMFGAFANFRRSRSERDLKRLEVLEKASELSAKGLKLPDDIAALLSGSHLPR